MPFWPARTLALVVVTGARSCCGGLQAHGLLLGGSLGSARMENFMVVKTCEESQPLVPCAPRTMHSRSAHLFPEPLFWSKGPRMSFDRRRSEGFSLRSRWCTKDRRHAAWAWRRHAPKAPQIVLTPCSMAIQAYRALDCNVVFIHCAWWPRVCGGGPCTLHA